MDTVYEGAFQFVCNTDVDRCRTICRSLFRVDLERPGRHLPRHSAFVCNTAYLDTEFLPKLQGRHADGKLQEYDPP